MLRTYRDFIAMLGEAGRFWPWWMDVEHCIRTQTPDGAILDPLTAVTATETHVAYDLNDYRRAALAIGIDTEFAERIVFASDLMGAYNAHIRMDITDALGIKEPFAMEGRWHDPAYHAGQYPHQYDQPIRCGGVSGFIARPATTPARWSCAPAQASRR